MLPSSRYSSREDARNSPAALHSKSGRGTQRWCVLGVLDNEDKSPTMPNIAAECIKNLPFKIIEKAGDWALNNPERIQQAQDLLFS
jgi:hypothetical protein